MAFKKDLFVHIFVPFKDRLPSFSLTPLGLGCGLWREPRKIALAGWMGGMETR